MRTLWFLPSDLSDLPALEGGRWILRAAWIYLMKMGAEGGVAQMDETFVGHFDKCLGCMACVTACPSGVQYGKLIEATRAQIERNYQRPILDRLFRRLIFWLFPHPNRAAFADAPVVALSKIGAALAAPQEWAAWPAAKNGLRSMESLLPEIELRRMFLPHSVGMSYHKSRARLRVGVLLGCVQRVLFSNGTPGTVRVLAGLGCEVIVPPEQECCGAMMAHTGRESEALNAARRLIEAFLSQPKLTR